ncbi:uncharacterized protein PgNI_02240, partial [Pyricularia grisea]|uniref:mannan endo-1,4-beta-mannosidase n=1 Tax=Pyricularia grisea TaxID=148305 RepID=A0A6P8BGL2_PYRGI
LFGHLCYSHLIISLKTLRPKDQTMINLYKFLVALLAGGGGVSALTVPQARTSAPVESQQQPQPRSVPAGFATTNGTHFMIDGETQYLVGSNAYWLPFLTNNADVDLALDQIAASGIKILRTWGFNDVTTIPTDPNTVWFQYLSSSGSIINEGANGLQRLDYIVAGAEKRGLKLIIPFVNNWKDYGGIPAYETAFGRGSSTWFKHEPAQAQYQAYIKALVSRYAASPAIFSWQLANEPRCFLCSTDDIFNWATKTSELVKSLDPNHLVSLGDEGQGLTGDVWTPYWLVFGTDFWRNLQIKTINFGTFHIYPTTWSAPVSFAYNWIKSHGSKCVDAGKPCYLEECTSSISPTLLCIFSNGPTDGVPPSKGHCETESQWQKWALETKGIAGDGFWQVGTQLSTGLTHDDTFTIYHDTDEWTCLVTDHVARAKNASLA